MVQRAATRTQGQEYDLRGIGSSKQTGIDINSYCDG